MAQLDTDLIPILKQSLEIELPGDISDDTLRQRLSSYINSLIESDFQKLVSILYRVDIDEQKLGSLLKENMGINAGDIITDLIIERQLQKIRSRQQFSKRDDKISDDERW